MPPRRPRGDRMYVRGRDPCEMVRLGAPYGFPAMLLQGAHAVIARLVLDFGQTELGQYRRDVHAEAAA